jgi:CDP-diacylglycerol--glycerol-3-phosphate 3-phosphatidyltransferase
LLSEDEDGNVTEEASLSISPKKSKEYAFAESAGLALREFTDRWRIHTEAVKKRRAQAGPDDGEVDTFIVPIIQMGPMAISQETDAMPLLFEAIEQQEAPIQEALPSAVKKGRLPAPKATIDFTSGYFSLYPQYKALILNAPASIRTRIITAAPISNGFFGSKGISRHLPPAYTWLENKFWDAVKQHGKKRSVEIREWEKAGWTYHAKGGWIRLSWLAVNC